MSGSKRSIRPSFNPRARGGRDTHGIDPRYTCRVSIHAPAGGATQGALTHHRACRVSIHAPAGGATGTTQYDLSNWVMFQSTRPRGARHYPAMPDGSSGVSFNPRARGGRDAQELQLHALKGKFQSTRPRGARPAVRQPALLLLQVSIHAPAGGATGNPKPPCRGGVRFNPRARGGRD